MRAIIFPLAFLRELIKENPAKCIIAAIAIWMFAYAGSLPDTKHSVEFYHQLELRGKWVGIYGDDFDTKAFDKKPDLKGPDKNIYEWTEYHPGNILLWIGFWTLATVLAVLSFTDEGGWCLDDVTMRACSVFVRCELEESAYVYTAFGRLLGKYTSSQNPKRFRDLESISSILALPRYETKSGKRNRMLKIVGI